MHADSHPTSPAARHVRLNDLIVDPAFVDILRRAHLDSLDALFAFQEGQSLSKPGLDPWRTRLRVSIRDGLNEHVFYLKRFDHPPRYAQREARRSGGVISLAGNEWAWIELLTAAGIPCLQGVAFGEQFHRRREVRSAILTAPAPGKSLEAWCNEWTVADHAKVRSLIQPAAALVELFHAGGLIHRDLYLSHLFFDPARPFERSLCLIDLARVIHPMWRMCRWIVKDLAALNHSAPARLITRADRVRWLRSYLNVPRLGREGKALAYRVIGKTSRMAKHDARKQR